MPDLPSSREYAGSDPDLSGLKLGNYQLLRRLGRGGMADVYLAEQISLRRQVAFKVLKRSLAEDEAYVRRFHNEARAAASLVHANIVQIHEGLYRPHSFHCPGVCSRAEPQAMVDPPSYG
jgi:serine/threonine protein kinase